MHECGLHAWLLCIRHWRAWLEMTLKRRVADSLRCTAACLHAAVQARISSPDRGSRGCSCPVRTSASGLCARHERRRQALDVACWPHGTAWLSLAGSVRRSTAEPARGGRTARIQRPRRARRTHGS